MKELVASGLVIRSVVGEQRADVAHRKMVPRLLLVAAVLLCSVAARHRASLPPELPPGPADIFSAARPDLVHSTHLDLDLTIDFGTHVIRGSVTHDIVNRA